MDDVLKGYNRLLTAGADWVATAQKPVTKAAMQAKENVDEMRGGMFEAGVPWWIPVAVIAFIGAGIWFYNMLTSGGAETNPQPFGNFSAGSPPMSSTETPFTEPR